MNSTGAIRSAGLRFAVITLATLLGVIEAAAQGAICPLYRYAPAQVENVSERVLVRPATRVVQRRSAVYRTIVERALVHPERRMVRTEPALYRTIVERVLLRPSARVPRYLPPIRGEVRERSAGGGHTGAARIVELRAAQTVFDTTPAAYKTRLRRVLVRPARVVMQAAPAAFVSRTRTIEVTPERVESVSVPAEYRVVTRRMFVTRPTLRLTLSEANCAYGGPRLAGPSPVAAYPVRWTPVE